MSEMSSVSARIVTPEPLPPPPNFVEVTLKLSLRDAVALRALCKHVGGDSTSSPRHVFDALSNQLQKLGIGEDQFLWNSWGNCDRRPNPNDPIDHIAAGIYFKNYRT